MPNIEISPMGLGLAIVANFFIGYLWYGPIFGKAWASAIGVDGSAAKGPQMAKALGLTILGLILMTFVLSQNIGAWTPSSWGLRDDPSQRLAQVLSAAGFTWLGFVLPVLFSSLTWEGRPFRFFAINAGYWLVMLTVAAFALVYL